MAFLEWLVSSFTNVIDSKTIEAHDDVIADFEKAGIVRTSSFLLVKLVPQLAIAERVEMMSTSLGRVT